MPEINDQFPFQGGPVKSSQEGYKDQQQKNKDLALQYGKNEDFVVIRQAMEKYGPETPEEKRVSFEPERLLMNSAEYALKNPVRLEPEEFEIIEKSLDKLEKYQQKLNNKILEVTQLLNRVYNKEKNTAGDQIREEMSEFISEALRLHKKYQSSQDIERGDQESAQKLMGEIEKEGQLLKDNLFKLYYERSDMEKEISSIYDIIENNPRKGTSVQEEFPFDIVAGVALSLADKTEKFYHDFYSNLELAKQAVTYKILEEPVLWHMWDIRKGINKDIK